MSASSLPYHHGNLRNALIIAAAELIERDGTLDFSISEAAAMVGVSAAAPYRHFADKEDLLGAVRHLAFFGLVNVAKQTAEQHPEASIEGILAMGHVYLKYAREKRVFFSLMWEARADIDERRENPETEHNGFVILVDRGQRILPGPWHTADQSDATGNVPLVPEPWHCHPGGQSTARYI